MRYWTIPNSAVSELAKVSGHTVSTHMIKEAPKISGPTNRSTRRYLRSKYGLASLGQEWKQHTQLKRGAAAADIVNYIARAGNSWATEHGLASRVEALADKVHSILEEHPSVHGVFIIGRYTQWEQRDFTGARATSALAAWVAGSGITPSDAIMQWQKNERERGSITPGAPRGWETHDVFFWATAGEPD